MVDNKEKIKEWKNKTTEKQDTSVQDNLGTLLEKVSDIQEQEMAKGNMLTLEEIFLNQHLLRSYLEDEEILDRVLDFFGKDKLELKDVTWMSIHTDKIIRLSEHRRNDMFAEQHQKAMYTLSVQKYAKQCAKKLGITEKKALEYFKDHNKLPTSAEDFMWKDAFKWSANLFLWLQDAVRDLVKEKKKNASEEEIREILWEIQAWTEFSLTELVDHLKDDKKWYGSKVKYKDIKILKEWGTLRGKQGDQKVSSFKKMINWLFYSVNEEDEDYKHTIPFTDEGTKLGVDKKRAGARDDDGHTLLLSFYLTSLEDITESIPDIARNVKDTVHDGLQQRWFHNIDVGNTSIRKFIKANPSSADRSKYIVYDEKGRIKFLSDEYAKDKKGQHKMFMAYLSWLKEQNPKVWKFIEILEKYSKKDATEKTKTWFSRMMDYDFYIDETGELIVNSWRENLENHKEMMERYVDQQMKRAEKIGMKEHLFAYAHQLDENWHVSETIYSHEELWEQYRAFWQDVYDPEKMTVHFPEIWEQGSNVPSAIKLVFKSKTLSFNYDSLDDENLVWFDEPLFKIAYEIDTERTDPVLASLMGGKKWINLGVLARSADSSADAEDIQEDIVNDAFETLVEEQSWKDTKETWATFLHRWKSYTVQDVYGETKAIWCPCVVPITDEKTGETHEVLRFYRDLVYENAYGRSERKIPDEDDPFLYEIPKDEVEYYTFFSSAKEKENNISLLFDANTSQVGFLHFAYFSQLMERNQGKRLWFEKHPMKYAQDISLREFEQSRKDDIYEKNEFYRSRFETFDDFYKEASGSIENERQQELLEDLAQRHKQLKEEHGLPAWIWQGHIYFNTKYFRKEYGVSITTKKGIPLFDGMFLKDYKEKYPHLWEVLEKELRALKHHEVMHRILQIHEFKFSRNYDGPSIYDGNTSVNRKEYQGEPDWIQKLQGDVLVVKDTQTWEKVFLSHEIIADLAAGRGDDEQQIIDRKLVPYKIKEINRETWTLTLIDIVDTKENKDNFWKQYIVNISDIEEVLKSMMGPSVVFSFKNIDKVDIALLDDYEQGEKQLEDLIAAASSISTSSTVDQTIIDANPETLYLADPNDTSVVPAGVSGPNVLSMDTSWLTSEDEVDTYLGNLRTRINNHAWPVILPTGVWSTLTNTDLQERLQEGVQSIVDSWTNDPPSPEDNEDENDEDTPDNDEGNEERETNRIQPFLDEFNKLKGDKNLHIENPKDLDGKLLYFRGDVSLFPGNGTEWLQAKISYAPWSSRYTLTLLSSTERVWSIQQSFTRSCTVEDLKELTGNFRNEVYKFPPVKNFQEMYKQFLDPKNADMEGWSMFTWLHTWRWDAVDPKTMTKKGTVDFKEQSSPLKYLGVEKGYSDEKSWFYEFYSLDFWPSTVTVKAEDTNKYSFEQPMDYNSLFIFMQDKKLTPFGEAEYKNLRSKTPTPWKVKSNWKDSFLPWSIIIAAIKKLPETFKQKWDQSEKHESAKVYNKLAQALPAWDWLQIWDVKADAESELDSSTWQVITEHKERLSRMEGDKEGGGVYKSRITARIESEIFKNISDKVRFRQKAAGYLLYALENEHMYFRELSHYAHTGIWVRAIMGAEHQAAFMKKRQKLIDDLKNKWYEDEEMFGQIVQLELTYIAGGTMKSDFMPILGSRFGKAVERYQGTEAEEIEKGKKRVAAKSNFYQSALMVRSKIQKLEKWSIVGWIEALFEKMEHAHHYKMAMWLIMQMSVNGVLENAVGNTGKARLAKLWRTLGIPMLVMCRYGNFSSISVRIMDEMAKTAGVTTFTDFVRNNDSYMSWFDGDETNAHNFTKYMWWWDPEKQFNDGARHIRISKAMEERWDQYGDLMQDGLNLKNNLFFNSYKHTEKGSRSRKALDYYMMKTHDKEKNPDTSVGDFAKLGDGPYYKEWILFLNEWSFRKQMMDFDTHGNIKDTNTINMWQSFRDNVEAMDVNITTAQRSHDDLITEKMLYFIVKKFFNFFEARLPTEDVSKIREHLRAGRGSQAAAIFQEKIFALPIKESSAVDGIKSYSKLLSNHWATIKKFYEHPKEENRKFLND